MDQIELAPYIFFGGNAREAMEFYKSVFGGELDIMDYDKMPPNSMPNQEAMKGKVMNASLTGGAIVIRGSDSDKASPATKKVELCLTGADEAKLRKIFDGLAAGGNVKTKLEKMFWGDYFGNLTDKFGVDWMVDITVKK